MTYRFRAYTRALHTLLFILLCLFSNSFVASAQNESIDKVLAVVGRNRIVLQSELEHALEMQTQQNPALGEISQPLRCQMLQEMILQKLLVEQAERDSTYVTDEEVEGQLDNRLRYYVRLYGSKEKLEESSGKTMYQLKEDNRDAIKEQMLAEKVRGGIIQNVKITPAEVRTFYNKIPTDSLPFYPAAVEMGQIVIDPPQSEELDKLTREQMEDIRKKVIDGTYSFETAAGIYSDDGSKDNGGDLGFMGRSDLVPEFSAAAFKLKENEISQVVKSKFGYHIIQMIKRQGDQAHLRHILKRIPVTSGDIKKANERLDSVRAQIIAGKITFQEAVGKYSTDENSKRTGGMILDPNTGTSQIQIDHLDPAMVLMLDSMKPGSVSAPQLFSTETGDKSCRIVYMKSRTEPHKANMKDDYSKIQEVALEQKKSVKLQQWLQNKLPSYYIKIASGYQTCDEFKNWNTVAK